MDILKLRRRRQRVDMLRKRVIEDINYSFKQLRRQAKRNPGYVEDAIRKYQHAASGIATKIDSHLDNRSDTSVHGVEEVKTKRSYLTSSLFLRDSFELLNKQEVESLHFVTGPEVRQEKVMDKIIDLKLQEQSMVYAKADTDAIREALIYLSDYGYRLWACIHIHPGSGVGSISPSGTDMALDKLLLKGGYDSIGAIFSRDGFVRFFSSKEFEINIFGKGVEKVNDKIYRLVEVE